MAEEKATVVLMLEDSEPDAELTLLLLRRSGFALEVHLARDREEFIEELNARQYDLILSDYNIPSFDGLLALEMVRAKNPRVPFIFVSGAVGEETAIETLHRGATDYVLKDRLERLCPAVRRALIEAEEHANRLRAEEKAHESEERFRQLTNALPQMVWTLDAEGHLSYTNPAWEQAMHLATDTWCDPRLVHPEDLTACQEAWESARESRAGFSLEARLLHHLDSEYHWYLIRVQRFGQAGEDASWLGTAIDLNEQRKREDALRTAEKLAVTGRMAATIAHEINNPLESLTNLVFLLKQEGPMSETALRYLEMADYELQRVSAISKQTLAFYRDSSTRNDIDARKLIDEALRLFEPRFRSKSIQVENTAEPGVLFFASRGEIRQVFINLISNAIDAVPIGGQISIGASTVFQDVVEMAEIRIEDNGSGIKPEHLQRIFEPFFSTKGLHGTGLGLWVSRGIAEQHGGTLEIVCEPNVAGPRTAVTLRLPRQSPAPQRGEDEAGAAPVTIH